MEDKMTEKEKQVLKVRNLEKAFEITRDQYIETSNLLCKKAFEYKVYTDELKALSDKENRLYEEKEVSLLQYEEEKEKLKFM